MDNLANIALYFYNIHTVYVLCYYSFSIYDSLNLGGSHVTFERATIR